MCSGHTVNTVSPVVTRPVHPSKEVQTYIETTVLQAGQQTSSEPSHGSPAGPEARTHVGARASEKPATIKQGTKKQNWWR